MESSQIAAVRMDKTHRETAASMLDVHPPHHAANTWRDFFVHIATIVVGLIIAVGLEQIVESVHRHHERIELEQDLRREATGNIEPLAMGTNTWLTRARWFGAVETLLNHAPAKDGVLTVVLPPMASGRSLPPNRAVWSVAKSSGRLALLPEGEAELFEHLDYIAEREEVTLSESARDEHAEEALERQFQIKLDPGVVLHLSTAERDALVPVLAKLSNSMLEEAVTLAACEGANVSIRENATTIDQMSTYARRYAAEAEAAMQ